MQRPFWNRGFQRKIWDCTCTKLATYLNAGLMNKRGFDKTEQWKWQMTGWLHDADWDQWPDEHCRKIVDELEHRNIDPDVIHAIASHGPKHFGVEPVNKLDHMLYAFDELSGFLHAYSLMRPRYNGNGSQRVIKRLKDKTFLQPRCHGKIFKMGLNDWEYLSKN